MQPGLRVLSALLPMAYMPKPALYSIYMTSLKTFTVHLWQVRCLSGPGPESEIELGVRE